VAPSTRFGLTSGTRSKTTSKSEEACLHLERGEHSSHEAKGVQCAEGACRLVAAELEELTDTLRAAAAEEGDGTSEKSREEAYRLILEA